MRPDAQQHYRWKLEQLAPSPGPPSIVATTSAKVKSQQGGAATTVGKTDSSDSDRGKAALQQKLELLSQHLRRVSQSISKYCMMGGQCCFVTLRVF